MPPGLQGLAVVSGIGQSEVGRRVQRSGYALTVDACLRAIADAGLVVDDIDGVATHPGPIGSGPGNTGAGAQEIRNALGLKTKWHLGASETGTQLGPVIEASMAVRSGTATHVVCFRSTTEASAQGRAGRASIHDSDRKSGPLSWAYPFGAAAGPVLFALYASRYMHDFGLTREQLGQVALTARRNAAGNPAAIFRDELTLDDYLDARLIAKPFGLFDCDVPVDGATAVVISNGEATGGLRRTPITIESIGAANSERFTYDQRTDLTSMAGFDAARAMWDRTKLSARDVDVAEIYDGFTFVALQWLEALGFCGHGEAGRFLADGSRIALDGDVPINTQGGQLSGGRLLGMGFLHEACVQLWGEGGARQVPGSPEIAVAATGAGPEAGCLLLRHT